MTAVKSLAVAFAILSMGCEMHPPTPTEPPTGEPRDAATNTVPEFFPGHE